MIILSFIVLLTIIYGFMDGGSPQAARNNRFDNTRIRDIKTIKNWVGSYYRVKKLLPATILDAYTNYNNTYTKIPSILKQILGMNIKFLLAKNIKYVLLIAPIPLVVILNTWQNIHIHPVSTA